MAVDPPSQVVIARVPTPEERAAELESFCRAIERDARRDTARTLGACAGWSVAGALAMGWSFASDDARWAPVVFWGALTASYTGIACALLSVYRRHLERMGEW